MIQPGLSVYKKNYLSQMKIDPGSEYFKGTSNEFQAVAAATTWQDMTQGQFLSGV